MEAPKVLVLLALGDGKSAHLDPFFAALLVGVSDWGCRTDRTTQGDNPMIPACRTVALALLLQLSCVAQAQIFRAYLASDGNDANPCTLAQPCRLLPAALAAVVSGGEIWMLDSANYNNAPVNMTKSVTILAIPGAVGSLVATAGNAMNINGAGYKVVLRNLVIVPLPGTGGVDGIHMLAGAALTVENCVIGNMPNSSIYVEAPAAVRIIDTTIRGNADIGVFLRGGARATIARSAIGGNGNAGIEVWGSPGTTTTADITDSIIDDNTNGVFVYSTDAFAVVKVSVRDSQMVRNSVNGAVAYSYGGAAVTLSVSNSIVSNNGNGIATITTATRAWASGNTVSDNGFGLLQNQGVFESAGNNAVRNNGTDTAGIITVIPTK
jgi:hypothetical protein